MFGFVYVTENLVNGYRYIGQRTAKNPHDDEAYLGSGTILKRAIKKYGAHNFKRTIIGVAANKEELNAMEIEMILLHQAVADVRYYNISSGGDGGNTMAGWWKNMSAEQRLGIAQRIRDKLRGRIRSAEHRAAISAAKMGINNWTPEGLASMVEKRKAQIAMGIGVPPMGNRGNTEYRHNEENKVAIKEGVAKARIRISTERDTYHTEEGMIAMREKLAEYYTEDVRQDHAKLIREGQARRLAEYKAKGVAPPKFHWYHDPNDATQHATFSAEDTIPDGWVLGMGKRKRKIDVDRVHELIAAGGRDAHIAREVGCAPSAVWQIRHDLKTK